MPQPPFSQTSIPWASRRSSSSTTSEAAILVMAEACRFLSRGSNSSPAPAFDLRSWHCSVGCPAKRVRFSSARLSRGDEPGSSLVDRVLPRLQVGRLQSLPPEDRTDLLAVEVTVVQRMGGDDPGAALKGALVEQDQPLGIVACLEVGLPEGGQLGRALRKGVHAPRRLVSFVPLRHRPSRAVERSNVVTIGGNEVSESLENAPTGRIVTTGRQLLGCEFLAELEKAPRGPGMRPKCLLQRTIHRGQHKRSQSGRPSISATTSAARARPPTW